MIFTRTKSGIANYGKFIGVDILAYVEGKNMVEINGTKLIFDELFYEALLRNFYPNRRVKVKCVGNRTSALGYAKSINSTGVIDSVVIVDRDGEDFNCSLIPNMNIIYTEGYSWENDFWTQMITQEVLEDLVCSNKYSAHICAQINNVSKWLSLLSGLDICAHVNKEALLPKNGTSCGIGFDFNSVNVVPRKEILRLIRQYKMLGASTCSTCRQLLPAILTTRFDRAIQGHLWEHVVLNLINFAASGGQKQKMPKQNIKNLAMSRFKKNPSRYMTPSTTTYYQNELLARFV